MKRITLAIVILASVTACDPDQFFCRIVNNTDQKYFYTNADSSFLLSIESPKKNFSNDKSANAGDTVGLILPKTKWKEGYVPGYFFFVKADDLINLPFDSILKKHLYIQKHYTTEEMQKLNYIVRIGE